MGRETWTRARDDLGMPTTKEGNMPTTTTDREPISYWLAYGLAGYGPELDVEDEPVDEESVCYSLHTMIHESADFAEDTARGLAESGDYEAAWREHERAETLATQAELFNPDRQNAPLYRGDPDAWQATVRQLIADLFPIYVSQHSALYVWPAEEV